MDRRSLFAGSLATTAGLRLSLSCFPSDCLGTVLFGWPECLGGRLKVPQRVAAHGAESSEPVPGKGRRQTRYTGLSGSRSALARRCKCGGKTARRGTFYRCPPPTLLSLLPGQAGGGPATLCAPLALSPGGTWPSSPSNFLPPAAGGVALRCSDASTPGFQHRGRAGSRVSSSTVAFLYISAFLCVLVSTCPCLSQFLSLILDLAYRIRSGFVSLSFSFPLFFLGCSRVSVTFIFSAFSPSYLIFLCFFPLSASLLSSLLPGPPEHHQLPYSETPCPGENTPALLGTSRYRDLLSQSRRRLGDGSRVLLSGLSGGG